MGGPWGRGEVGRRAATIYTSVRGAAPCAFLSADYADYADLIFNRYWILSKFIEPRRAEPRGVSPRSSLENIRNAPWSFPTMLVNDDPAFATAQKVNPRPRNGGEGRVRGAQRINAWLLSAALPSGLVFLNP